ncbi:MAG: NAD-dependent epimerase/dehydratase family protein [Provencibacterium sp.]|jgi:UDP-glucose 4-epimerase|nr:NAD-dependent epimerase/dehydratase family protein [Provencibacterium sp.]
MGNYLVTGAAGFIGSALARQLLGAGHAVTTIDNLSTGIEAHIPEGCHKLIGNTFDSAVLQKLNSERFDAIYHIAGQSGGIISFEDPIYDLNSNAASTLLLLDYARKTGCPRFIYASSMSVYGDENPCPITEQSSLKPKSFYAVGKMASENYMRIYTKFGIKCTALRFNNVYGPGQNLDNMRQGMVSIFVAQAIRNHAIHVLGPKERFRDFVYIEDVVRALLLSEKGQEPEPFNVYNVATNIKTTVEELINEIQKNLPSPVPVRYEGSTPGDQFGIYCSYEHIKECLHWKPAVSLREGICQMMQWATQNEARAQTLVINPTE